MRLQWKKLPGIASLYLPLLSLLGVLGLLHRTQVWGAVCFDIFCSLVGFLVLLLQTQILSWAKTKLRLMFGSKELLQSFGFSVAVCIILLWKLGLRRNCGVH